MAKIKHASVVDIVDQSISHGVNRKILHLNTEKVISGRKLVIHGKEVVHFGNCNYLGLEQHPKVKEAAIDAINSEGIRLTLSRAYVSSGYYNQLEDLLGEMYGGHAIVAPSSTMLHMSAIPVLFNRNDLVLLDQQVHASMTQAVQYTKANGVSVKTVRHNRYDLLENFIEKYQNQYEKVWYVLDGIYSMYGDAPDIKKLIELLDYYPNFYLYVDDAHGCSWIGENGKGFILNQVPLHEKMMMTLSLGKGFGVIGGVLVTKNSEPCRRVRTCGNTMIFSAPLSSGLLGAAIASAKIHLSPELPVLQADLLDKIQYCNKLIKENDLPLVREEDSPIFFIGCGLPKIAYRMLEQLKDEGFLVNIGVFPAVSLKCAGVRFLITCHLTKEDILTLVLTIKRLLPKAIAAENFTYKELAKSFSKPEFESLSPGNLVLKQECIRAGLRVEKYSSISEIDPEIWNVLMHDKGACDYSAMKIIEEIYTDNVEKENNWKFRYYLIKDNNDKIILACFFTVSIWKEDLLAPPSISKELEEVRKNDPYYMTSQSISLGCQALEGEPLYLHAEGDLLEGAIDILMQELWDLQEQENAELIIFRDIDARNKKLTSLLQDKGFMVSEMPDHHEILDLKWENIDEYIANRTPKSRAHLRKYGVNIEDWFDVKLDSDAELDSLYDLYLSVKSVNYGINTFSLPKSFFKFFSQDEKTDIFTISPNENCPYGAINTSIAFLMGRQCDGIYYAMILGLNYDYLKTHSIYRHTLYQVIKRANKLGCQKLHLGFSASIEKRKLGAIPIPKIALLQYKDDFKQVSLNNMSVTKLAKHY